MPNIEIGWKHDGGGLRIEAKVADLLGWTAEELAAQPSPLDFLAPSHNCFGDSAPDITARTMSETLRHKDGSPVPCRVTVICRCGGDGATEAWGSIRQFSQQDVVDALCAWWRGANPAAQRCLACFAELYPSS